MKKKLFFAVVFSGILMMLQGCYTILDIPESDSEGYITTIEYMPIIVIDPVPVPPPPTYYPPSNGGNQPVTVEKNAPKTKDRNNENGNIRNDGNGRGNSGRDTDFTSNTVTRNESYSSSNNNSSSNGNSDTRSSSNTRNSGNGRR